jgi:hypothetical protein
MSDDLDGTKWCAYCEGVADFQWLDGGFYVCTDCIKDGETDTEGESK